uniref:Cannabinoid receptor-like 1 n=1 Tax=Lymnaea stagnalis TaxID=6523 RepID=A0A0N7KWU9_LYMST|nr:cannabinoid receptor-like 1 [Lymnaea stagnalis]
MMETTYLKTRALLSVRDSENPPYMSGQEHIWMLDHNQSIILSSVRDADGLKENITNDTEYDYDANAHFEIPTDELVPLAVVYGLTLLIGVIGNALVIVSVTRYQRMRSITNIFLLSLASADLLVVCICIPVKCAAFISFTWTFGEFLCKAVHYLQNVSSVCSVLTLTTMSLERYYAIRHPMRAKYVCTAGRAWRVTCVLWTLSIILAMPIIFQRVHKLVGVKVKAYWCINNWESVFYSRLYEVYMLLLMLIVPLLIMTFAYVSIIRELWTMASLRSSMTSRGYVVKRHSQNTSNGQCVGVTNGTGAGWAANRLGGITRFAFRSKNANGGSTHSTPASSPGRNSERSPVFRSQSVNRDGEDDKTKIQVIKMLVAVIVVFILCWAPILISNTLTAFGYIDTLNYGYLKPMRQVFYLMSYANSCINPVIYGFMSKHFRSTFYHALCTCWKSPRGARSRVLMRQTSWQSRSTNIREFGDLELTSVEVTGCGPCTPSNV